MLGWCETPAEFNTSEVRTAMTHLLIQQFQPQIDPVPRPATNFSPPLDLATRARFEPCFGYDLSTVRIYHDPHPDRIGALAFTVGRQIHLGANVYALHTAAGQRLLAHELTHVIQQAEGRPGYSTGALEAEAEQQAARGTTTPAPLRTLRPLPLPVQPMLQCYTVPGSLRCSEVVAWLRANSPYAPEWAETRCTYSFNNGIQIRHATRRDGRVQVTARGLPTATVTVDCPTDRPEWTPTERPNRAAEMEAWNAMRTALDAHEAEHHRIGQRWRATLERRLRAVSFTVIGSDAADATQQAQDRIAALQQQWQNNAQAAQEAIDPFRGAVLSCPPAQEDQP